MKHPVGASRPTARADRTRFSRTTRSPTSLATPARAQPCPTSQPVTIRTCFFYEQVFFTTPVFFLPANRYMTVTRPLRLKSTQALGILGFWGSVNRSSLPAPSPFTRLARNPICPAQREAVRQRSSWTCSWARAYAATLDPRGTLQSTAVCCLYIISGAGFAGGVGENEPPPKKYMFFLVVLACNAAVTGRALL